MVGIIHKPPHPFKIQQTPSKTDIHVQKNTMLRGVVSLSFLITTYVEWPRAEEATPISGISQLSSLSLYTENNASFMIEHMIIIIHLNQISSLVSFPSQRKA